MCSDKLFWNITASCCVVCTYTYFYRFLTLRNSDCLLFFHPHLRTSFSLLSEREDGRERNTDGLPLLRTWSTAQPRCVPCLGIESVTFLVTEWCSNRASPAKAHLLFLSSSIVLPLLFLLIDLYQPARLLPQHVVTHVYRICFKHKNHTWAQEQSSSRLVAWNSSLDS